MTYDVSRNRWNARIEVDGQVVYEGTYPSEIDAVLSREIALLKNEWRVERNIPEVDLAEACACMVERLEEPGQPDDWHPWAASVGLSLDEFLGLAGLKTEAAIEAASVSQAEVLDQLIQERGVARKAAIAALEAFILDRARKQYGEKRRFSVQYDPEAGIAELFVDMVVVRELTGPDAALHQIHLEIARRHWLELEVGDELVFQVFYREQDHSMARKQDMNYGQVLWLWTADNFIAPLTPEVLREGILKHLRETQGTSS